MIRPTASSQRCIYTFKDKFLNIVKVVIIVAQINSLYARDFDLYLTCNDIFNSNILVMPYIQAIQLTYVCNYTKTGSTVDNLQIIHNIDISMHQLRQLRSLATLDRTRIAFLGPYNVYIKFTKHNNAAKILIYALSLYTPLKMFVLDLDINLYSIFINLLSRHQ